MGINQRVSLRKFIDDIRRWVEEDRSDEWIASALGTSPSSVQSFRSRNAIYRRGATSTLHDPQDFSPYEGVLEPEGVGGGIRGRRAHQCHAPKRAQKYTPRRETQKGWTREGPFPMSWF